ncbi:MAG: DUF2029 domain-containing protein [Ktedonobacterales bacterium]|nr:DUF2029 domain-containing protein [Ktedonobacterales bacterium]
MCLLGIVIALQNLLELPRGIFIGLIGLKLTSVGVVLVLGGSLALLLVALRPRVPTWRWLRARPLQAAILLATLAAVPIGLHQLGATVASVWQPPVYFNDGTTLDHYAAMQLGAGHNPYVTTDIVSAVRLLGQDPAHTTPLRRGAFAALGPTAYPSPAALRATFAAEPAGQPDAVLEFESHVSYPALAFLPLVPFVKLGLPSVVPFFALCFLALATLLMLSVPPALRLWVGLLIVADAPLLSATLVGDLDVLYILLLFVAWRWWRRPFTSALTLGLALAAKQLAWFFLPFYLMHVARALGWRQALARAAGAGGVFVLINGPFVLNAPRAWLAGVLAPQVDPMFPLGNGLIRLALAGILPLAPSGVYGALEALAIVAALVWYWRYGQRMPEVGFVLAVVPLFFAWRSLTTYFYFVALPALALVLARQWEQARVSGGLAATVTSGTDRGGAIVAGRLPRRRRWRRQ